MKRFVTLILMVFWLVFLSVELQSIAQAYYTLTPDQITCIEDRVAVEKILNPKYVWGAAGLDPGSPGDCSGKLYAIFFS